MRMIIFLLVTYSFALAAAAQPIKFTIRGRINPESTAEKVFLAGGYFNAEVPITADKTFFYEGSVPVGVDCWIYTDKSYATFFWVNGGEINMVLQETNGEGADPNSKHFLGFASLSGPAETEKFHWLLRQKDSILNRFANLPSPAARDSVLSTFDGLLKDYILEHPRSNFSLRLVHLATTKKSARDLVYLTDKELRKEERLRIENEFRRDSLTQPGLPVADFRMKTINGTQFSSQKLRSKYTLLEFWAHDCVPCRQQNPALVELYQQYRSRGFTIVGVGVETSKAAWQKAINEDKLPWTQVSDLRGWNNHLVKRYFVQAIPFNILMDENKKIVAADLHPEMLKQKLAALFAGGAPAASSN